MKHGFTLIELLVVISIIAILAVTLVAIINPLEQRKRTLDATVKETASEYTKAQARYSTVYGCFTPSDDANPGSCADSGAMQYSIIDAAGNNSNLVTGGDVKQSFIDRISKPPFDEIMITVDATGTMFASFIPQSQSFKDKATCDVGCTDCVSGGTYYCVPGSPD